MCVPRAYVDVRKKCNVRLHAAAAAYVDVRNCRHELRPYVKAYVEAAWKLSCKVA